MICKMVGKRSLDQWSRIAGQKKEAKRRRERGSMGRKDPRSEASGSSVHNKKPSDKAPHGWTRTMVGLSLDSPLHSLHKKQRLAADKLSKIDIVLPADTRYI